MKTLVFIPAWNEEEIIADVVRSVQDHIPLADILVVDDGSTDKTSLRARSAGASVLQLPFNQGVGAAHQTAYLFAQRHGYEKVGQVDGDGQHPAEELLLLLKEIDKGADLAVGSRAESNYRSPLLRRAGQQLFSFLVSFSTGQKFTDTTSGMRALGPKALDLFSKDYSPEFAEVESLQSAARAGLHVVEVPVRMKERSTGSSFITAPRAIFYVFKTSIVLLIGHIKNKEPR